MTRLLSALADFLLVVMEICVVVEVIILLRTLLKPNQPCPAAEIVRTRVVKTNVSEGNAVFRQSKETESCIK